MRAKITQVFPTPNTWNGPNGPMHFVQGTFADGSGWSSGCSPERSQQRIQELSALIGQDGEFDIEPKPDHNGQKQWKLKGWPGKPVAQGGGGRNGGNFQASFRNTREGELYEQSKMDRRTALMQSVALCQAGKFAEGDSVLSVADAYFAWLSQGVELLPPPAAAPTQQPAATTTSNATPSSHSSNGTGQPHQTADQCAERWISGFNTVVNEGALRSMWEQSEQTRNQMIADGRGDLVDKMAVAKDAAKARLAPQQPQPVAAGRSIPF